MLQEIYNNLLSSCEKPVQSWDRVNFIILDSLLENCITDYDKKDFIEKTVSEIINRINL